jgi:hypothetical protein
VAWGVAFAVVTWDIHPVQPDLSRLHDPLSGWSSLELVERHNVNDTWKVTGPASVLGVFEPGMGCILDRDGDQVTSGRVKDIERWTETDNGRQRDLMSVTFASYLAILGGRTVLPNGNHVLTASPTTFASAYDTRTGSVESLILQYAGAHIGSGSLANRRHTSLVMPTSLNRGGTTTVTARFDNLGVLVQSLAEAGRLRVTVQHDESSGTPRLALRIAPVPDVSANIRFGPQGSTAMGLITGQRLRLSAPEVTRAIVLAGGEKEARQVLQLIDAEAEAAWGTPDNPYIAEQTVDQRQTVDAAEMTRAAEELIAEGAGTVEAAFDPVDGPDVQYRVSHGIGYKVGVDLDGLPDALADNVVREARTIVQGEPGQATEQVRLVVGTPDATLQGTKQSRQVAKALRRVTTLERSA